MRQLFRRTSAIFMLGLLGVTTAEFLSNSGVHAQQRQTLGECISDLRQQGFYSKDAADRCQKLLEGQNQFPNRFPDRWDRRNSSFERGGNPQAISDCMNKLMYEQRLVCTRSYCSRLSPQDGFGGWQRQTVRTAISEDAAVRACRNAR